MHKSPYAELNEHFADLANKSVALPSIDIAEVLQPLPNLVIRYGDLQIDEGNIIIADHLLPGYTRSISLSTVSASGETALGGSPSHTHVIDTVGVANTTATTLDTLKKGDYVVVSQSADKQKYIVLCKAVSL